MFGMDERATQGGFLLEDDSALQLLGFCTTEHVGGASLFDISGEGTDAGCDAVRSGGGGGGPGGGDALDFGLGLCHRSASFLCATTSGVVSSCGSFTFRGGALAAQRSGDRFFRGFNGNVGGAVARFAAWVALG
jgi:hypothetical protein